MYGGERAEVAEFMETTMSKGDIVILDQHLKYSGGHNLRGTEEVVPQQPAGTGRVVEAANREVAWECGQICTASIVLRVFLGHHPLGHQQLHDKGHVVPSLLEREVRTDGFGGQEGLFQADLVGQDRAPRPLRVLR